jgi:monomeric sarcosine oxidase
VTATVRKERGFDVAVIGAGVFGSWTARSLRRSGRSVVILDGYGAANSRSSSSGESRIIRMGYGPDEVYTRSAMRSLEAWKDFERRTGQPIFQQTGVLWLARQDDPYVTQTEEVLKRLGIRHQRLTRPLLAQAFPQIDPAAADWGLLEPESGVIMARQAVRALVKEAIKLGALYRTDAVEPPAGSGRLHAVVTTTGERIEAEQYVFACGPWMPKLFPDLLTGRIHPTRQEVFFFGPPAGDKRFAPPQMPAWIDFGAEIYGVPDLERRGFKIGFDRHGPPIDPDTGDRAASPELLASVRAIVSRRFPALAGAPLVESRVCQYENTSSGDFLIDRHPTMPNVWLVGGGSGHGFKHGPAVAQYVCSRLEDSGPVEPRFSLATKDTVQQRLVF